ncbi:MAG: LysR substrate-binding domain-containing protein [Pseudomonadota bacterium]
MRFSDLPNLNALRAFCEVARTKSFTLAAKELGVTQSAVSKQVAVLEKQLKKQLVIRKHRSIDLTQFGQGVAQAAGLSFEQIQIKLANIERTQRQQIKLFGDADFVQLWLFPRLSAFERANPQIRISITVSMEMNQIPDEDFDFAIIWGRGAWQGCRFEPLLRNYVFPVAAPDYFQRLGRPPRMSDITESQLIHDQTTFWWRAFRDASGGAEFDHTQGRLYNHTALCLEAAARGDGVTIGDEVSTRFHLETNRLDCPMAYRLPSPDSYYIATPINSASTPELLSFKRWLFEEAEEHRKWFQGYWSQRSQ